MPSQRFPAASSRRKDVAGSEENTGSGSIRTDEPTGRKTPRSEARTSLPPNVVQATSGGPPGTGRTTAPRMSDPTSTRIAPAVIVPSQRVTRPCRAGQLRVGPEGGLAGPVPDDGGFQAIAVEAPQTGGRVGPDLVSEPEAVPDLLRQELHRVALEDEEPRPRPEDDGVARGVDGEDVAQGPRLRRDEGKKRAVAQLRVGVRLEDAEPEAPSPHAEKESIAPRTARPRVGVVFSVTLKNRATL